MDLNEVNMRIYLPEKVIIHRALMSTEIELNNCFVIWLYIQERKFSTFTFVVEVMFNLQLKDFLKFYQLLLEYFNLAFCILKFILILWMWNAKFNNKNFFLHFVYSNKDKWTIKTKQTSC